MLRQILKNMKKLIDSLSSHLKFLDERHKVEMASMKNENQQLQKEVQDLKTSVRDREAQKMFVKIQMRLIN